MVLICITIHEIHNYMIGKPMFLTSIGLSFVQLKTKAIPTGSFTQCSVSPQTFWAIWACTEEMKFWLWTQSFAHLLLFADLVCSQI